MKWPSSTGCLGSLLGTPRLGGLFPGGAGPQGVEVVCDPGVGYTVATVCNRGEAKVGQRDLELHEIVAELGPCGAWRGVCRGRGGRDTRQIGIIFYCCCVRCCRGVADFQKKGGLSSSSNRTVGVSYPCVLFNRRIVSRGGVGDGQAARRCRELPYEGE